MIEVIHHGGTSERKMCPNCNCDFMYFKVDIEWADLLTRFVGYVHCPECGEKIVVKREESNKE